MRNKRGRRRSRGTSATRARVRPGGPVRGPKGAAPGVGARGAFGATGPVGASAVTRDPENPAGAIGTTVESRVTMAGNAASAEPGKRELGDQRGARSTTSSDPAKA
jgi:hypothetical protein